MKDLSAALTLFNENKDQELRDLSDHCVQDVVMYKSLDSVSVAVLIHALYKARQCALGNKKKEISSLLEQLITNLKSRKFGAYNKILQQLFNEIRQCVPIDSSLKDVIYLAQIQKVHHCLNKV